MIDRQRLIEELSDIDEQINTCNQCIFDYFLGVSDYLPIQLTDLEQRKKEIISILSGCDS